jgi:hypothetical protein
MSEDKKTLTESQRIARVFASQGRPSQLAAHLPESYRKRAAALCNADGKLSANTPTEFAKILRDLINDQKAAVQGLEE